ncbi:SAM-dependent methyltransferase [Nocardiopsis mwathae]|uniref:SAM-dependent methyltransferase n=1 Tax=Nocardiopsis mwathae TaxID=1472723 RepID=A0A7W9YGB3_9ACTN|nr:class I SAM-dependent methyltransferase [Nocardiopsis mwathae]MBB6171569.1 SAM-dependent methyltransferase [Nocardiopsis mwathae]
MTAGGEPSRPGPDPRGIPATDLRHPVFARIWPRLRVGMDRGGMAERRRDLLAGLAGRVIEVGAGDGADFAHYPPEVTGVLAVEPEPRLRALARAAARTAPVPVRVTGGIAEALPAAEGSFDAAVASHVLCSVRDEAAAAAELHRVLRPGGRLRFLGHVGAAAPAARAVEWLLDATFWPRLCAGCHLGRTTLDTLRRAGFRLNEGTLVWFHFPEVRIVTPGGRHVLAELRRP